MAPSRLCGVVCVDVELDHEHCGGCESACDADEACIAGACEPTCAPPRTDCGGACVDVLDDVAHCGACGHACAGDEVCNGGTCEAAQTRIGWVTPLGDIEVGRPDFIVGTQITVPAPTTLTAFGIIAHDAGHAFQMALYRDEAGIPTDLVASTGVRSTSIGAEEHSVDPTSIAPGAYWLVAIYDVETRVGFRWSTATEVMVRASEFSDPLPDPLHADYADIGGYLLNYWIVATP